MFTSKRGQTGGRHKPRLQLAHPEVASFIADMWFKLTFSLQGIYVWRFESTRWMAPLPSAEGNITLWNRAFAKEKNIPAQLCCTAQLNRALKPDIASMFASLSNRTLPPDKPLMAGSNGSLSPRKDV